MPPAWTRRPSAFRASAASRAFWPSGGQDPGAGYVLNPEVLAGLGENDVAAQPRPKRRLKAGATALGAWLTITDPAVAEIMAVPALTRCGSTRACALVAGVPADLDDRVQRHADGADRARALERPGPGQAGARPRRRRRAGTDVRTVAEVRALVSACHYPPEGIRASARAAPPTMAGTSTATSPSQRGDVRDPADRGRWRGRASTSSRAARIDALASARHLSGTVGVLRQHEHPTVQGAIDKILRAASAARRRGLHGSDPAARAAARLDRPRRAAGHC